MHRCDMTFLANRTKHPHSTSIRYVTRTSTPETQLVWKQKRPPILKRLCLKIRTRVEVVARRLTKQAFLNLWFFGLHRTWSWRTHKRRRSNLRRLGTKGRRLHSLTLTTWLLIQLCNDRVILNSCMPRNKIHKWFEIWVRVLVLFSMICYLTRPFVNQELRQDTKHLIIFLWIIENIDRVKSRQRAINLLKKVRILEQRLGIPIRYLWPQFKLVPKGESCNEPITKPLIE